MSQEVRKLEPSALWNHFADLNEVPRASKKEERVIAFIEDFARAQKLEYHKDEVGNVIVKKPASEGMTDRKTVVLQSHLDMVHQKNNETVFDFETEGIKMIVEDDWVKAKGTTLGADNGIGVAAIMAILASKEITHPPLEALFTIDEETGMTGAQGLKAEMLDGSILLNLDTEDDNELTIGCAGGVDVTASGQYPKVVAFEDVEYRRISIKGLNGGHSGMDIHKGFANANKVLARLLLRTDRSFQLGIKAIDGGGLRNAIPREAWADISIPAADFSKFETFFAEQVGELKAEHIFTDKGFSVSLEPTDSFTSIIEQEFQSLLLRSLSSCPNGVYRMSPEIPGLVQTSNNLARVLVQDGKFEAMCLTRSSVETEKMDLVDAIRSCFELMGSTVQANGSYPGWQPKPTSEIVELMSRLYKNRFNEEPEVQACHAGLECGIIGRHYPSMEMISFGPNIRGAHSPDERAQISSVDKFWGYLLETLENIPS